MKAVTTAEQKTAESSFILSLIHLNWQSQACGGESSAPVEPAAVSASRLPPPEAQVAFTVRTLSPTGVSSDTDAEKPRCENVARVVCLLLTCVL